ncbi:hypothetical protein BHE74_00056310 [Ensete ventricosum]|nr:hypothetical protein BHE74_00056310 [Ensete ventricosum]
MSASAGGWVMLGRVRYRLFRACVSRRSALGSTDGPYTMASIEVVCARHSPFNGQASDQSEDDAVGNSLGVRQELAKGIRSLPGLCKRVRRKKTEARKKIIGGGRNAYRELEMS